jgi:hypothetical protein
MNKKLRLIFVSFAAIMLIMISLAVAGCTNPAEKAQVPVQTPVAPIQPAVTPAAEQIAPPAAAPAEHKPAGGPIASVIGAQVPGQVEQVNESIMNSIAMGESNPTVIGQEIPDLPFMQLYAMSSQQIALKVNVVTLNLVASSYPGRVLYSPVAMNLAADDLGFTAEQYADKMNNMTAENASTEQVRIVYLKYLLIVKNAAYSMRDAAIAESNGNYDQASSYTDNALTYLDQIKQLPDQSPKSPLNRMEAYLQYYNVIMKNKAKPPSLSH